MNLCYCNRATHYIRFISPWCYELCTFFFYFFNQSVFFRVLRFVKHSIQWYLKNGGFFFSRYFVWVIPSQRAKTLWIWNNWHFPKSYFVWMSQMYSDQNLFQWYTNVNNWRIHWIHPIIYLIWSVNQIRFCRWINLRKKILFCSFFFLWLSESKCSSNPP